MSDKRNRNHLSPTSPEEKVVKRQNCLTSMPADMSVKELADMLTKKIDCLETNIEAKINKKMENLATKSDLQQYADEVKLLRDSNEIVKATLEDIKKEKVQLHKHIELMDRQIRSKNIIVKGTVDGNNTLQSIQNLLLQTMKINDEIEIDETKVIKKYEDGTSIVLVKFVREQSIRKVFSNIKQLAGTKWRIERDYTNATREQMNKLLVARKHIKSLLVDGNDKKIGIIVIGNRMTIRGSSFYFNNEGKLWCENKPAYVKLNSIFVYNNFNEETFDNLVYDRSQ